LPSGEQTAARKEAVNLVVDLDDRQFDQPAVHHALEMLAARGVQPLREHRASERTLAWIDAEFGGSYSGQAASGGIWLAQNGEGILGFASYGARVPNVPWTRRWQSESDVAMFGPFGVVARARKTGLGAVLLHAALFALRERGFRRALIPAVTKQRSIDYYARHANARAVERFELDRPGKFWRTTVLASGNGTNFQSVVDGARAGTLPLDVGGLIVNRPEAFALERAARAGIPSKLVYWERAAESRAQYDARVLAAVKETAPELVLLLGWMHVLSPDFVAAFPNIINLHPAFLPLDARHDTVTLPDGAVIPAYRGKSAVDEALADTSSWIGASVHRVNVAVDRGEVLARAPLRTIGGEPREALDARLHALEHRVLAAAIRRWADEQR
jgi:phosphoribosylglycinamide formyltransferase-1